MAETSSVIIKLIDKTSGPAANATNAVGRLGSTLDNTSNKLSSFSRMSNLASTAIGTFAGVVGAQAVASLQRLTSQAFNTGIEMQSLSTAIEFASGSSAEYKKNIEFLRSTSNSMGLDLKASMEGFKTLSGAMRGTALEGEATRDLFESIGMASTTMQLSSDQSKGALLALSQIMSKGKVQAEELRGQLGERIPGAFNIAAKAMGVTQAELNKMLEAGEVISEDFLPKFARQLRIEFAGGVENSAQTVQANLNRLSSAFTTFAAKAFNKLEPLFNAILSATTKAIEGITGLYNGFSSLLQAIASLEPLILAIAAGYAAFNAVALINIARLQLIALWSSRTAIAQGILTAVTGGLSTAFATLNAIMLANPIAAIVAGIAALAVGVVYAWNQFEGFRGAIVGVWEVMKVFIDSAMEASTALVEFFSGNFDVAAEHMQKASINGAKLGKAFAEGYADGANSDFRFSLPSLSTSAGLLSNSAATDVANQTSNAVQRTNNQSEEASKSLSSTVNGVSSNSVVFNIQEFGKVEIRTTNMREAPQQVQSSLLESLVAALNQAQSRLQPS